MLTKIAFCLGGTAVATAIATAYMTYRERKELDKKMAEFEKQSRQIADVTDKAIEDLAEMTPVAVRDEIVDKAIRRAVERNVADAVDRATAQVKSEIHDEISRDIRQEIRAQRDRLVDDVDRKLREEVELISRDDIANDVQRKVTNMIIDRMDGDLNDIKERYSRKVEDNVKELTRTYRSKLELLANDFDRNYTIWKIGKV